MIPPVRPPTWSLRLACLLATLCVSAIAAAQPAEERHFAEGVLLFSRGQYDAALQAFEASRAIRETASVAQNVGACLQALSRHAEALQAFRRASELGEGVFGPAERRRIERTIRDLRGRVAELTVRPSVPDAEVLIDGRVAPQPAAIDPGHEAVVEVHSPGHRAVQTRVRPLVAGPFDLAVTLEPLPRTGRVTLSANLASALARVDGGDPHPLPWSADLEAGGHELAIGAPGHREQVRTIEVRAGEELRVEALLVPEPPAPAVVERRHVPVERPRDRGPGALPWVLGGIGAAAVIAAGVVAWALAAQPLEGDWVVQGP